MNVSVCAFAFLTESHSTIHYLAKNLAKTQISGTIHNPWHNLKSVLVQYFQQ